MSVKTEQELLAEYEDRELKRFFVDENQASLLDRAKLNQDGVIPTSPGKNVAGALRQFGLFSGQKSEPTPETPTEANRKSHK